MFKLYITVAIILIFSGCATKKIPYNNQIDKSANLIKQVKNLQTNSANLKVNISKDNKSNFLNISMQTDTAGYLKLIAINNNFNRELVLPNASNRGYINKNQKIDIKYCYKNLNYILIIFSQKNARMIMIQGTKGYNTIKNNRDLIKMLKKIKYQEYGKSYISIIPIKGD